MKTNPTASKSLQRYVFEESWRLLTSSETNSNNVIFHSLPEVKKLQFLWFIANMYHFSVDHSEGSRNGAAGEGKERKTKTNNEVNQEIDDA